MRTRGWLLTITGGVAIAVGTMSFAWACGKDYPWYSSGQIKITIENATSTPWDPNSAGKDGSDCPQKQFRATPHTCGRSVTITGNNFVNNIGNEKVASVGLYWVDTPFYGASLGQPDGAGEDREGRLCIAKGVLLAHVTVTNGSFTSTPPVAVPPTASTTTDRTLRPGATAAAPSDRGKFTYGQNAVCAVWTHTADGVTHYGSTGVGYKIFPAIPIS